LVNVTSPGSLVLPAITQNNMRQGAQLLALVVVFHLATYALADTTTIGASQLIKLTVQGPTSGSAGAFSLFQLTFSQPLTGFGATLSTSHFQLLQQGSSPLSLAGATLNTINATTYSLQLASNIPNNGTFALRFLPPGPPQVCTPIAQLNSSGTPVTVGTGTPASCTEAAFATAIATGGYIKFNCGTLPASILLNAQYTISKDTVIDGQGLITLDGQNKNRIFYLKGTFADYPTPRFQIQRLTLTGGNSAAQASGSDIGGGGAILVNGGTMIVVDCIFINNRGIVAQQDAAGGAIYATGSYYQGNTGGMTYIVGSTFIGNSASNGGGIGALGANVTVQNCIVAGNLASGNGGNPGNGGNGGAISIDGPTNYFSMCGMFISANQANVFGKAFFRVGYGGPYYVDLDQSMVYNNFGDSGFAALYLQNITSTITNSLIANNPTPQYTIFLLGNTSTVTFNNVQVVNNVATANSGAAFELGSDVIVHFSNLLIANNSLVRGADALEGSLASGTFSNMVIVPATGQSACTSTFGTGTNIYQWPSSSAACFSSGVTFSDPNLGVLSDNGCVTPTINIGGGQVTTCSASSVKFASLLMNAQTGATATPTDFLFELSATSTTAITTSSSSSSPASSLRSALFELFVPSN